MQQMIFISLLFFEETKTFHVNRLLADNSHEILPYFL